VRSGSQGGSFVKRKTASKTAIIKKKVPTKSPTFAKRIFSALPFIRMSRSMLFYDQRNLSFGENSKAFAITTSGLGEILRNQGRI
jgi:hypothetical protein